MYLRARIGNAEKQDLELNYDTTVPEKAKMSSSAILNIWGPQIAVRTNNVPECKRSIEVTSEVSEVERKETSESRKVPDNTMLKKKEAKVLKEGRRPYLAYFRKSMMLIGDGNHSIILLNAVCSK